ncbi:MAG: hypothetical protein AVDCRST_MAG13-1442, partial [uncultured Solirubrobacteraceae bacterium]
AVEGADPALRLAPHPTTRAQSRSLHQGRRRAVGAGGRHDPHVGAALRLPGAVADELGLPALQRGRRGGAAARRRLPPPRAVRAGGDQARLGDRDARRPPVDLRRGGRRPRRAPADPQEEHARGAVARHRARDARPGLVAHPLRRLPARAVLPRGGGPLPAHVALLRRGGGLRRLPRGPAARRRAGRGAHRAGRQARQRVGRDRRRPGLRRLPARLGGPRGHPARQPERHVPPLRVDLDARPARDPQGGGGRRAPRRHPGPGLRRGARDDARRPAARDGGAGPGAHGAHEPRDRLPRGRGGREPGAGL